MGVPQVRARVAAVAVDLVLDLEVAAHSFRIHVVRDRRAAQFDGAAKDVDERLAQAGEFGAGEAAGLAAGANAGAEEGFVGVDVADSVEQGLVEQRGLDGGLAAAEKSDEVFEGDGQGFAAGAGVGSCRFQVVSCRLVDGEAAEAARVDEADLAGVGEVRTAWVWGGWGTAGSETSRRPVMPRWMRNSDLASIFFESIRLTVITMVLPTRRTLSMVAPANASAISVRAI